MKFVVGRADEIPPGGRKIVRVAGRSIGVFNVNGQFYAIRNRCPHQGAPLCEGKLWGVLKADVPGSYQYDSSQEIIGRCARLRSAPNGFARAHSNLRRFSGLSDSGNANQPNSTLASASAAAA